MNSQKEVEDTDSDDDFAFLDDDDYVSPAQQALLEQAAARSLLLRALAGRGLGAHLDESPEHFLQLYSDPLVGNLVLHIVDAGDSVSAVIDVVMEDLAQRYCGTHFRRIARAHIQNHPADLFKETNSSKIVSIKDGVVVNQSIDILSSFFVHHGKHTKADNNSLKYK